ncbi:MAG: CHAT domain-containing protein [Candidatus Binatia bacterium]
MTRSVLRATLLLTVIVLTNAPASAGERSSSGQLGALEAKALEAERSNQWAEAAGFYNQASSVARVTGLYEKAIAYGNKAFETGEKAKVPGRQARAILHLSHAYRRVGQQAKARELLQKGVEIVKQIPPGPVKSHFEAIIYEELGQDFLSTKETQKAIDYISYSLQVKESLIPSPGRRSAKNAAAIQTIRASMSRTLEILGNAYRRAENAKEAIKAYEKALSIIKSSALVTPVEARIYQQLGQLYLARKDFDRAMEYLVKSVETADKNRIASVIDRGNSEIGDLLRELKRPAEAVPYYQKAIASIESSRAALESEELRSSFFENKRRTYNGIILAYIAEKNWEEAFNYSERARSRAFLDILGAKVQLARGSLLAEEQALQAKMSVLRARLAGRQEDPEEDEPEADTKRLVQDLEEAQKAYNDFLSKIRKENREQASLMNVEPLNLKEAQQLLEPGVTMLEYFVVAQRVLLWVVEKDRVRFASSPIDRRDLVRKIGVLRESALQPGEKEKFSNLSQELYKLLIEPALPHIRGRELLIVPHDVLHYLPFHALLSSEEKYLIQDYPVYYLSSASLMQFTREKRRASRESALVLGNPSLGDPAYNLRFAEREAKEVAVVYPKSAVYLKEEASKSRAVSFSPKFEMLHFAVHAEFNEDDPMSSALLLAPEGGGDGRLRVEEIFSLNLNADMVVLSACETGLGKISNGDEIIGLTRAFIYAGTPSIVTTLWKVNDRSSYELMREFYSHLKSLKKSEALRQAQLKTMKDFPEPFYWAAYQLTGEP